MRNTNTMKIAFCGLIAALSVIVMFLTGLIPIATLALPAIAGCLLIAVVAEAGVRWAFGVYVVCGVLSFMLAPDREAALFYILFFGYYPTLFAVIGRIKNRIARYLVKLCVFNAAVIAEFFIAVKLLGIPFEEMELFGQFTALILLVLGNVVFIIYDLALDRLISTYYIKMRPKVKKVFKI